MTDFGLAKLFERDSSHTEPVEVTRSGAVQSVHAARRLTGSGKLLSRQSPLLG